MGEVPVLRPGRHPRQVRAAEAVQGLAGHLGARGGTARPAPQTAPRGDGEGGAADDEPHEQRGPQHRVGHEDREADELELIHLVRDLREHDGADHEQPEQRVEGPEDQARDPGDPASAAQALGEQQRDHHRHDGLGDRGVRRRVAEGADDGHEERQHPDRGDREQPDRGHLPPLPASVPPDGPRRVGRRRPGEPRAQGQADGEGEEVLDVGEVAEEQQPDEHQQGEREPQPQPPGRGHGGRRDGHHGDEACGQPRGERRREVDGPEPSRGGEDGDQREAHQHRTELAGDEHRGRAPGPETALRPEQRHRGDHQEHERAHRVQGDQGRGQDRPEVTGLQGREARGDDVGPRPAGQRAPERARGEARDREQQHGRRGHRAVPRAAGELGGTGARTVGARRAGLGLRLRRGGHRHVGLLATVT